MKLLFYLRKAKMNKNGTVPIFCRITVNSSTYNFATGARCNPQKWDVQQKKVKGNSLDANEANIRLDTIQYKIRMCALDMERLPGRYLAKDLYQEFIGRDEDAIIPSQKNFIETMAEYLEYIKKVRVGLDEISNSTYSVDYFYPHRYITEFLAGNNLEDIKSLDFGLETAEQYHLFLQNTKKLNYISISKSINFIRRVVAYAIKKEYIYKDPLINFKPKISNPKKELVYLTADSLGKLEEYAPEQENLQKVKNVFLFSCYTGLAYADLKSFSKKDIQEYNGRLFIVKQRLKGRNKNYGEFAVPLSKKAVAILEKYGFVLPIPKCVAYNKELKMLALLAGIEVDRISSHTGRKTFAMLALNEHGIPLETVSKMLGHASVTMTEKVYANVNLSKIFKDTIDY